MAGDTEQKSKSQPTSDARSYPFTELAENAGSERHYAPAAARNTQPILEVLASRLPASGHVLELASGTGEHAVSLGRQFPGLTFQPSDPDPVARGSIQAWIAKTGLSNVMSPIRVDASEPTWERSISPPPVAMLVCNMVHISPWEATLGLLRGAAALLPVGGGLFIYGPYSMGGQHTAPTNMAFHNSLVARNPAWGVRDVDDISLEAGGHGLELAEIVDMPANNLILHLRKVD